MDQGSSVLAPGLSHAREAGFLPQEGEPLHAYRARLWAMHDHLSTLIDAVERGAMTSSPPPSPPSPPPPLEVPDVEGHLGAIVVRRVVPAHSAERIATARHALARQLRPDDDPFAAPPGLRERLGTRIPARADVDPVVVCWAINVVCWLLVVAVAMIWGLGSS
jgi:hypothetical protein